jgi:hypothetical protein
MQLRAARHPDARLDFETLLRLVRFPEYEAESQRYAQKG